MSIEALWYSMFEDGKAPHCTRLSRLPIQDQWLAAIDLAISFARGAAGYRQTFITRTREQYWYWSHPGSRTGWWLIPERVAKRAFQLYRDATTQACRQGGGSANGDDTASVLLRWKDSRAWRRHAAWITPRRDLIPPVIPPLKRRGRPRDVEAIRARAAELRAKLWPTPVEDPEEQWD